MTHPTDTNHTFMDIGALALIMGSFVGYMPVIASALAGVWYAILIFDRLFKKKS